MSDPPDNIVLALLRRMDARLDRMDRRLERIERRLDLIDAPAA